MAQSGTPSSATSVGNQETPTVTAGEELGDGQLSITAPLEPPVSSVRLEDRAASACKPPPRPRWHMSALPEPGRSSQCPEAAQVRETLALQLPARTPDSRGKQPKTGRAAIDPQRAQASLVIPPPVVSARPPRNLARCAARQCMAPTWADWSIWLVPIHSDTLILKTRPTELRVAPSALPRASCGHGR